MFDLSGYPTFTAENPIPMVHIKFQQKKHLQKHIKSKPIPISVKLLSFTHCAFHSQYFYSAPLINISNGKGAWML